MFKVVLIDNLQENVIELGIMTDDQKVYVIPDLLHAVFDSLTNGVNYEITQTDLRIFDCIVLNSWFPRHLLQDPRPAVYSSQLINLTAELKIKLKALED